MARLNVVLKPEEKEALLQLAERERRDPRAQAGLLIVRELQRAGLLPTAPTTPLIESRELAHAGAD